MINVFCLFGFLPDCKKNLNGATECHPLDIFKTLNILHSRVTNHMWQVWNISTSCTEWPDRFELAIYYRIALDTELLFTTNPSLSGIQLLFYSAWQIMTLNPPIIIFKTFQTAYDFQLSLIAYEIVKIVTNVTSLLFRWSSVENQHISGHYYMYVVRCLGNVLSNTDWKNSHLNKSYCLYTL